MVSRLPKSRKDPQGFSGFTLAELLIALAILGVIATFTIPKVITAQQNNSYNAKAHEAAAMITAAYQVYALNNAPVSASTTSGALTQYMNYVNLDTTANIDWAYTLASGGSSASQPDLLLHNGARLVLYNTISFGGTNPNNAIIFMLDPDGVVTDGTTNGPGKSIQFFLYYSGRIGSYGAMPATAVSSDTSRGPNPNYDPPWFTW